MPRAFPEILTLSLISSSFVVNHTLWFFSLSLFCCSKFKTGFFKFIASDKIFSIFPSTASFTLISICLICSSDKNSELVIIIFGEYKISPFQINKSEEINEQLIIFENEMHIDFFDLKKYKKIYFVLLDNKNRSLKLSSKVLDYKKAVVKSQFNEYQFKAELLDENGLINLIKNSKKFDVVYPSIGENLSFLKRLIKNNDLAINFITRNEDEFCWKFSNKGYFNFKSNIPIILSTFKLN